MNKIATLEFGEFTPDQPNTKTSVIGGKNVVPNAKGYTELKAETQVSDAITARARGSVAAKSSAGDIYNYVGDNVSIYSLAGGTHTDITRASGAYTTGDGDYWEFAKFGDDMYATNYADLLQKITLGGSNFVDVTAAPNGS